MVVVVVVVGVVLGVGAHGCDAGVCTCSLQLVACALPHLCGEGSLLEKPPSSFVGRLMFFFSFVPLFGLYM